MQRRDLLLKCSNLSRIEFRRLKWGGRRAHQQGAQQEGRCRPPDNGCRRYIHSRLA
jgi:hypothetical protein